MITLTKTVAVDPTPGDSSGDTCSTTRAITVEPGTPVVYCYRVRNNSTSLVLTTHRVVDNRLGTILDDFPAPVGPGVSVFVTQEATIYQTTRSTATWTASIATASLADSDSATVTVRKSGLLALRTTVGVDPTPGDTCGDTCPTTYTISVPPDTPVIWCYRIRNTSATVTLHRHTIVDAELGTLADDVPSTLGPGATLFLAEEGTLERTTAKKGRGPRGTPTGPSSSRRPPSGSRSSPGARATRTTRGTRPSGRRSPRRWSARRAAT
jgi:hypothetical protein